MNKIIQFFDKSENYAKNLICGLMTVILGFLFVESILHTMHLVCDEKTFEGIFMHHDNIFVNACYFFFIFVALLFIVPYLEKIPLKIQITVLSVVTFALGLFWIMTSQCKPASDSYLIVDAAQKAAENDFSFLKDNYYHNYTYLYGSIAYFEVLVRLFGEGHSTVLYMQLPNLIYFIASYIGIIIILGKLFNSKRIQSIACFTLLFCIQPLLFSVFVYGIIPGFCFSVYTLLFEIMYFQSEKKTRYVWAALSAIFMMLAVVVKTNNYIVLIAIAGLAFVKFLNRRRLADLAYIIVTVIMSVSIMPIIVSSYEKRADIELQESVPMIAWLAMGLDEPHNAAGCTAPGWYSGVHTSIQHELTGFNSERTAEETMKVVKERLEIFANDFTYANDFFYEKITSQWNEPTYASLWINWVRPKYNYGENDLYKIIIEKNAGNLTEYMNIYQQYIFFAAFVAVLLCFKKKDILCSGILLIVLGGFMYHLIFEAKSQYILPYFVLLCGFSAVGTDYVYTKLTAYLAESKRKRKNRITAREPVKKN